MKTEPRTSQSFVNYKLKPYKFPDGMTIVVDTREQAPLFGQRLPKGMVLCSATLHDGDYSIRGFEDKFAIERKCIGDLWPYVSSDRDNTKKKMLRFKEMEFVGLVIEERESDLYRPQIAAPGYNPELIRQCLVSFGIRYGVHVYISNRENISRWVIDHCIKFWNVKHSL